MLTKYDFDLVINPASKRLIKEQNDDGSFLGDVIFNAWPVASSLILRKHIGLHDKTSEKRAINWLINNQNDDGSWSYVHKDSFPSPSLTYLCQSALKLCEGVPADIITNARIFFELSKSNDKGRTSRILLGLIGEESWNNFSWPPIYLIFIPKLVERMFSAWTRDVIVSGMIIRTIRQRHSQLNHFNPLRNLALLKAKKYLLDHQLADGSWYGTDQPTIFSTLALYELGYSIEDICIKKAITFLKSLEFTNGYMRRFKLTTWDSILALMALSSLDDYTEMHKKVIKKNIDFILKSQLPSGAFAYNPNVILYPDMDDTAMAAYIFKILPKIYAIHEIGLNVNRKEIETRRYRALTWILSMQNSNGGWAAFTKNQCNKIYKTIPSYTSDPKTVIEDPATPDVTGHVLLALGVNGYSSRDIVISKAIQILKHQQMPDGSWYGRWGLCYTYGTSSVLEGLRAVQEDMSKDYVNNSFQWLVLNQNADGGWGENVMSYYNGRYINGKSTVEHTSWALMGLCSSLSPDIESIENGCRYLMRTWSSSQGWPSFPAAAALDVYEHTLYSKVYPIIALSKSKRIIIGDRDE